MLAQPYHGLSSAPSALPGSWAGVSLRDGLGWPSESLTFEMTVVNIVVAFCMGTDLEGIMSNPIGQPMATVRTLPRLPSTLLTRRVLDPVQQPRTQRHAGRMVNRSDRTVSVRETVMRSRAHLAARYLMGSSIVSLPTLRI